MKFSRKRYILKNEQFVESQQDIFTKHLIYTATIYSPNDDCILKCDVELSELNPYCSNINMFLYLSNGEKLNVVYSKFYFKTNIVHLELLEIKNESLRSHGLGTLIFKSWLNVIRMFSERYKIAVLTIQGQISEGGNFTPIHSKKLYRKFDGYAYSDISHLVLNKQLFKHNCLEYKVTIN